MPNPVLKYDTHITGAPTQLTRVGSTSTNQYFGSVLVNSATATAFYPVTTGHANSDSLIHFGYRFVGFSPAAAAVAPQFAVVSLVAGTGFILRSVASTAVTSFFVDWQLMTR